MSSGSVITNSGFKIILDRAFKAPTYTVISKFKVGTGTTTPSNADTDLVTPVIISGVDYTKTFVSGYPAVDETTLVVTTRCLLDTTEANGNSLTEFGLFNTDGTAKCYSRCVHTAITKTSAVQVLYLQKDRVTS